MFAWVGLLGKKPAKLAIATSEGFFPEVQQTLFSEGRAKDFVQVELLVNSNLWGFKLLVNSNSWGLVFSQAIREFQFVGLVLLQAIREFQFAGLDSPSSYW